MRARAPWPGSRMSVRGRQMYIMSPAPCSRSESPIGYEGYRVVTNSAAGSAAHTRTVQAFHAADAIWHEPTPRMLRHVVGPPPPPSSSHVPHSSLQSVTPTWRHGRQTHVDQAGAAVDSGPPPVPLRSPRGAPHAAWEDDTVLAGPETSADIGFVPRPPARTAARGAPPTDTSTSALHIAGNGTAARGDPQDEAPGSSADVGADMQARGSALHLLLQENQLLSRELGGLRHACHSVNDEIAALKATLQNSADRAAQNERESDSKQSDLRSMEAETKRLRAEVEQEEHLQQAARLAVPTEPSEAQQSASRLRELLSCTESRLTSVLAEMQDEQVSIRGATFCRACLSARAQAALLASQHRCTARFH